MSKGLPAFPAREVVRILEKAGFVKWRQKGSHLFMHRAIDRRSITVPIHVSKTIPKSILHGIVKETGLSNAEFLALL